MLRGGELSLDSTVTFKYLMIASVQTSYCWGYCGVLDPQHSRPAPTTERPAPGPPWTPHTSVRWERSGSAFSVIDPQCLLDCVYTQAGMTGETGDNNKREVTTSHRRIVGECHNKRRGVITDLSVLPPSNPSSIYISEIKTWTGEMSTFVQYKKKVFNAPKLRVH